MKSTKESLPWRCSFGKMARRMVPWFFLATILALQGKFWASAASTEIWLFRVKFACDRSAFDYGTGFRHPAQLENSMDREAWQALRPSVGSQRVGKDWMTNPDWLSSTDWEIMNTEQQKRGIQGTVNLEFPLPHIGLFLNLAEPQASLLQRLPSTIISSTTSHQQLRHHKISK